MKPTEDVFGRLGEVLRPSAKHPACDRCNGEGLVGMLAEFCPACGGSGIVPWDEESGDYCPCPECLGIGAINEDDERCGGER